MAQLQSTVTDSSDDRIPYAVLAGRTGQELRLDVERVPERFSRPTIDWDFLPDNDEVQGIQTITADQAAQELSRYVSAGVARSLLSDIKAIRDAPGTKSLILGIAPLHQYARIPDELTKPRTVTFQDPQTGIEIVYNTSLFTQSETPGGVAEPDSVVYENSFLEDIVQSARYDDPRHDSAKIYVPASRGQPGKLVLQGGTIELPDRLRKPSLQGGMDMSPYFALTDNGLADPTGTGARSAYRWAAGARQPTIFSSECEERSDALLFIPDNSNDLRATVYRFALRSYGPPQRGGRSAILEFSTEKLTSTGVPLQLISAQDSMPLNRPTSNPQAYAA